jgi:hypothetical protein
MIRRAATAVSTVDILATDLPDTKVPSDLLFSPASMVLLVGLDLRAESPVMTKASVVGGDEGASCVVDIGVERVRLFVTSIMLILAGRDGAVGDGRGREKGRQLGRRGTR